MSNFSAEEWHGNLAAEAYKETKNRKEAVHIMMNTENAILSELQAILMWQAIDAYVDKPQAE